MPKRGWARSFLIIFGIGLVLVVMFLAVWSLSQPMAVIGEKTAQFASVMRVVRPLILLAIIAAWRPTFEWLQRRSWVHPETASRALAFWPRLVIWTALVEVTLGQGFVVFGLLAMAVYWWILRGMIEP